MALVRIPQEGHTLKRRGEIVDVLASIGIEYELWEPAHPTDANAPSEEILAAYSAEIEKLKARGGYVTADVINVNAQTPNLDAMLAKFSREHWHDEDEVRFIIHGSGLFHIHPKEKPVVAIEVEAGDLIRVPRGTLHWFDLCADRQIRAIRLFQDPAGWTPNYTNSGAEANFQPVCFGKAFVA
ncbi:MAG: cupin domain-containing protein [Acidobacteria bacterium]|nr:cupin domain-containing protein [Acidobacteriota bacterium]